VAARKAGRIEASGFLGDSVSLLAGRLPAW
jgi:hypothetical protein